MPTETSEDERGRIRRSVEGRSAPATVEPERHSYGAAATGQKYVVRKADGSPPDPNARYLILRLDTDPKAREAGRAYAEAVAASNPRLADAILSTCRARVKADWALPPAPRCRCGSKCRPIAMRGIDRWQLEWECQKCCDPVEGAAIAWPFVESYAEGEDFERLGIDWDNA